MRRFSVRPAPMLKGRTFFNVDAAGDSHVYRSEADVLSGGGDWASA